MSTLYTLDSSITDTWIRSDTTDHHGTDVELVFGRGNPSVYWTTLIKWLGLTNGTIPTGKPVVSASIRFWLDYCNAPNATIIEVYRTLRAWTSSAADGIDWTSGNNWTEPGARGLGTDIETIPVGTKAMAGAPTQNAFYTINLEPYRIYEIINGLVTYTGFAICIADSSPIGVYTSDSADTANEMQLSVTVTDPTSGIMGIL